MKYLRDGFRIEPMPAFHEARKEIASDRAVGPGCRHAVAQVCEMIVRERAGVGMRPIRRDAMAKLRLWPAVAANQYSRLDNVRMIAREHQGNLRADAATEHDRAGRDALVGEDAENVTSHVAKRERRARFGRAPEAAQVHRYGPKARGEALYLVEPQVVIERERMDEHKRRPLSRRLIIDGEPVGLADRHW